jgi:hypothetical protein
MTQPVQPRSVSGSVRAPGAGSAADPVRASTEPSPTAGLPTAPVGAPTEPAYPTPPSAGRSTPPPSRRSQKAQRRHARVVIRKVAPWSVFRMSVVFYLCLMLVLLGAGMILYGTLGAMGALDSTTRLIRDLFADQTFVINGRWLFTRGLAIGLLMVVVWSLINVFIAFLYNLISDLVGGIEVTLAERR